VFRSVFTCHPIRNGETYLSQHLTANDYYAEGEQVLGVWLGKAAEQLGLSGQEIGAKDAAFEALRTNTHPQTGEKLTERTGKDRVAFYDFQCSAPKSVSIMAATFGDVRLVDAHKAAVTAAFRELERYAGREDNTGGEDRNRPLVNTGNVVAAAFTHDASRELDAQLHTHLVTANATFDATTGKWNALNNREMFQAVGFAGRVYQAELARRVQLLGYAIREDRENGVVKGFEIEGVTAEDCEKQSTRRKQIEAEIERFKAEKGRAPTTGEKHVIATDTREKKLPEITTPEVRAKQISKYNPTERIRLEKVAADARECPAPFAANVEAAVAIEHAAEHLLERQAVVSARDILTCALQENVGRVSVSEIRRALETSPTLLRLTQPSLPETARMSSREELEREIEACASVRDQQGHFSPLGRGLLLSPSLGDDQRRAVAEIVASRDGVLGMIGRAGAGKTHTLKEVDRLVRAAGVAPVYAAPTHKAKEVLRGDGFEATTCSQLLVDLKAGKESLRGKMLVVDEAGMLSNRQGADLLRAARAAGARVLLVGDDKQLTSVETGDWLALVRKHSPLRCSVLDEIRRQKDERYREAMLAMSRGEVRDGLKRLDAEGWVHEGRADYLANAARSWLAAETEKPGSAILVSPTWREIDRLNDIVRGELSALGTLRGPERAVRALDLTDYTAAQRRVVRNYEPGMYVAPISRVPGLKAGQWVAVTGKDTEGRLVLENGVKISARAYGAKLQVAREVDVGVRVGDCLMLQSNDKKLGVINGERVTVRELGPDGLRVLQDRTGRELTLPSAYRTFVHGYAVTAEKSQGATVDRAIVAAEKLDGRRTYVAASRGRRAVEIHLPEKQPVLAAARNAIDAKEQALDHGRLPPPRGSSHHFSRVRAFVEWQRQHAARAFGAVRDRLARAFGRPRAGRDGAETSQEANTR